MQKMSSIDFCIQFYEYKNNIDEYRDDKHSVCENGFKEMDTYG